MTKPIIVSGKALYEGNVKNNIELNFELSPPTPEQLAELKEEDEVLIKKTVVRVHNEKQLENRGYEPNYKLGIQLNESLDEIVAILPKKEQQEYFCAWCGGRRAKRVDEDFVWCERCKKRTEIKEALEKDQPKEMPPLPPIVSNYIARTPTGIDGDIDQLIDCVRDLQERIRKLE